jgi:copper chaperone CopZ
MQRISKLTVILLVALSIAVTAAADSRGDLARTVFAVEGMHCGNCSSTITATLKKVDGVVEASADHQEGRAEAVYHPRKVDVEKLKAEIEKLGYTVTGMETEAIED